MNQREIRISEILSGKTTFPLWGKEEKAEIFYSAEQLSNEEFSEALEKLAFKLLNDKLRSKAAQKGFSLDECASEYDKSARIIKIDLAEFFKRKAGKRIDWSELEASEIAEKLEASLDPEKLAELLSRLGQRKG